MLKTKSGDKIGESSENFRYIAKIRYVANFSLFFLLFCFKIFTLTAKINTRKIKKNCRKVKNKLEQRLT